MSFSKFFGFAFLLWGIVAVIKIVFLRSFGFESSVLEYFYWILVAGIAVVFARGLGTINYLEAILVAVFWFLISLAMDFVITSPIMGTFILGKWQVWVGYFVMMLGVFFFHKKRHVEIRREQAAHHGHH